MPQSTYAPPDPHDHLAPRPDDPRIGRWWWWAGHDLDERAQASIFRWPVSIMLMMLVIIVVALGVVLLVRPGI